MRNKWLVKVPYYLLYLLSFYPIMKEAFASVLAIVFIGLSVIIFYKNFHKRIRKYKFKPLLINCGFYLLLILSLGCSNFSSGSFSVLQSSVLLIIFPVVGFYFFPRIDKDTIKIFSLGFIVANLILIIYFFNVLVEGMAIDRFPGLVNQSISEQVSVLNQFPYEFTLSKAEKHLQLIYEPHKVYLSIHFLVALIFSVDLIFRGNILIINKIILGILSLIFSISIIYTQALTSVFVLCVILFISPLFYFQKTVPRIIYTSFFFLIVLFGWFGGLFENYKNKNTSQAYKFIEHIIRISPASESGEKRIYIYDCATDLIKDSFFLGYGVANVQDKLNACYKAKDYVVSEYKSLGSEINTHNYYLHLWLSAGFFCVLLFLILFAHNSFYAVRLKNYTYLFFLFLFMISLLTENILVRMLGVFLFAIINTLFYSHLMLEDETTA